jgi:hypothetical protein
MINKASKFHALLTTVGVRKLAAANAQGKPWTITHMGVGDANGADPVPDPEQSALINECRRAPLNRLVVSPANAAVIIAEQVIPADVGGFWIRELGLYDEAGDLVAIANCAPSYKPELTQGSGRTQVVRMNLAVSSTSQIVVTVDGSNVMATQSWVNERIIKVSSPTGVQAGTYTQVRVNERGLVLEGANPTTLAGYGITDAQPLADVLTLLAEHDAFGIGHVQDLRGTVFELGNPSQVWGTGTQYGVARGESLGVGVNTLGVLEVTAQAGSDAGRGAVMRSFRASVDGAVRQWVQAATGPRSWGAWHEQFSTANFNPRHYGKLDESRTWTASQRFRAQVELNNGSEDSPEVVWMGRYIVRADVAGKVWRLFYEADDGTIQLPISFDLGARQAYLFGSLAWHRGNQLALGTTPPTARKALQLAGTATEECLPVAGGQLKGHVASVAVANQYRIAYGPFGTFWRNDGADLYLMITREGDPLGTFNTFRPLKVSLASGQCDISGNAQSATRLQHDRRINGVVFNGTQDITVQDPSKLAPNVPNEHMQGTYFTSFIAPTIAAIAGDEPPVTISNGGNSHASAVIQFHRIGSHAAYFGMDTDNLWKVGGRSMGPRAHQIWHDGNMARNTAALGQSGWWRCGQTAIVRMRGVTQSFTGFGEAFVWFPFSFGVIPVVTLGLVTTSGDPGGGSPGNGAKLEMEAKIQEVHAHGFVVGWRRVGGQNIDYVTVHWIAEAH